MQGPYPIFCRGHSGGRLVCEAFIRNGIRMGNVTEAHKDTNFFSIRSNNNIREIILNTYAYLNGDQALKQRLQELMQQTVLQFLETEIRYDGPFGWKIDPTVFVMPVLLDAFPSAKAVHVIRDGRDIMFSRLNSRVEHLDDPVNRLMMFGDDSYSLSDAALRGGNDQRYRDEIFSSVDVKNDITYGQAVKHHERQE